MTEFNKFCKLLGEGTLGFTTVITIYAIITTSLLEGLWLGFVFFFISFGLGTVFSVIKEITYKKKANLKEDK